MEQLTLDLDLTKEETYILGSLKPGRLCAIPASRIARDIGMSPRAVRMIIRHLIDHHHAVIGSATNRPAGFYLITDQGEFADALGALRHRGISILVRVANLSGNSLETVFHQGRLELEAEANRGT